MARTDTLNNFLTDVADAIRSKTETTGKIPASEFDARIAGITTGGGTEDLSTPLTAQDNLITIQESKLTDILTELQNKASGGDTSEIEDSFILQTVSGDYVNNRIDKVGFGIFYEDKSLTGFTGLNVTSIGDYAFRGCSNLISLNTPKVITIGQYALYQVIVPDLYFPEVTTMGSYTFGGNNKTKTITLPKLLVVPSNGFRQNTSVTKIDLGACTTINSTGFYNCTALVDLIIRTESVATLANTNALSGCSKLTNIYVYDTLVDSYKTASNWATYADKIKPLSELED